MSQVELQIGNFNRPALIKKGRYLEYFTIGYNSLEGLIALTAGLIAGSIALVGFGFDSLIGWWADPVAALVMVPIITKEGVEALRGETCCD